MKKIVLLFCIIFLLSGCASVLSSEIPVQQIESVDISNDFKKRDMTFSISYFQEIDMPGTNIIVNPSDVKEKIKDTFKATGLFRKIKYVDLTEASDYHYHFNIVVSGPNAMEQMGPAMLSGFTFLVFPTYNDFGVDMSMQLYVNGRETYGISAPQRVKDIIWLPFFFTWPFLNHATTGYYAEKNAVNFFANEIISNKLYKE